jgi:transcription elongation GreA/GreB family factor
MIDIKEIEQETQEVKARIDELMNIILPQYRQDKSKHAEQGDLRENAEYDNAISNIQKGEAELVALQNKYEALTGMGLDEYVPTGYVGIGSTIDILRKDTRQTLHFIVVVPELGDASKGRLPTNSKLGSAVLGKQTGEIVWVQTSSRSYYAEIVSVN